MASRLLVLLLTLASLESILAQPATPVRNAATGILTGHVYCADTNAPARMATVMLEPAKDVDGNQPDSKVSAPFHVTSVQTLLDGSFTMDKVAVGTYYVIATMPGYVSPFAALGESIKAIRNPDKALQEKYAKFIPRVSVQANLPATIEVRLERGAAIIGNVRFDDGSPAGGLVVRPLVQKKDQWLPIEINGFQYAPEIVTDDQGNYRISGLSSGEYLIEVDLRLVKMLYDVSREGGNSSSSLLYTLPIYSGGNFRAKDAKPFALKLGEQRAGEDLDIALSKIHRLSGTIIAARDGHVVNSSTVALLNADDQSEAASTKLTKDDTTFTFSFVPEGNYLLRMTGAKDVRYEDIFYPAGTMPPSYTKEDILHVYGKADQPIHIGGEVSGITVTVPESAATGIPQISN